jgi:P-type E1-E2 ATPase
MLKVNVPGFGDLALQHLVLDLNGTIALDGEVLPGVAERLSTLSQHLTVHLISADTRGRAAQTASSLGVDLARIEPGKELQQKGQFVWSLGPTDVVAVGNGANDAQMLGAAALGVAVLGPEGCALEALQAADVVVPGILNAFDLLLDAPRLIATLRR